MSVTRPADILRQLEGAATDADLIARFVASRDATAFEELVRRYGSLVLGVCRRVVGHPQDAEDAFQAVFLILAQKAGSLRAAGALGNWLYGVAYRISLRARRSVGRRRAREVTMSNPPETAAPPATAQPELLPILDEELAALPVHYRDAIVMCDLQGTSREDAALALGVPEGTLSSRLANGRKRLAARLAKRGVALSIAALAGVLGEVRAATVVSTELASHTARLATNCTAGEAVPRALSHLLKGGSTVRNVLIASAALVAVVAGAVFAARPGAEPPPPPIDLPKPPAVIVEKAPDAPKPKEESKAVAFGAPKLTRATDLPMSQVDTVLWNATGTHIAVLGQKPTGAANGKKHRAVVALCEVRESKPFIESVGDLEQLVGFAEDGKSFATALREYQLISGRHELKFWTLANRVPGTPGGPGLVDLRELKFLRVVKLDATETYNHTFTPELKTYRAVALARDTSGGLAKIEALEFDTATGKARSLVTPADRGVHALSRDGKRLAVFNNEATQVTVYDLDRGEEISSYKFKDQTNHPSASHPFLWLSPDGKRLVASRGVSRTTVLNADTGVALPELEGAKELHSYPDPHCFTGDGRLLAATCRVYQAKTIKTKTGQEQTALSPENATVLTVWNTQTGKALKSWRQESVRVGIAFCPTKPLLAIFEQSSDFETRLGFWDFAAEAEKK